MTNTVIFCFLDIDVEGLEAPRSRTQIYPIKVRQATEARQYTKCQNSRMGNLA
jgi:hypothetical protein